MFIPKETIQKIYDELTLCVNVIQDERYHPEKNVQNHSLQCMLLAARESTDVDLVIAATLHDVGKRITKLGHDKESVKILTGYVSVKSLWLIENHMRVWALILGEMKKFGKIRFLIEHPWLPELIHLARIDKMGRQPNRKIILSYELIEETLDRVVNIKFESNKVRAVNEGKD